MRSWLLIMSCIASRCVTDFHFCRLLTLSARVQRTDRSHAGRITDNHRIRQREDLDQDIHRRMGTTLGTATSQSTITLVLSIRRSPVIAGRTLENSKKAIGRRAVDRDHQAGSPSGFHQDARRRSETRQIAAHAATDLAIGVCLYNGVAIVGAGESGEEPDFADSASVCREPKGRDHDLRQT